ncbi:MAG: GNAT family N-acetyltransferase [Anaerolineae bacterium]|nr:GNAT family N-acetyltransferase [Anaerolineae bacterium]MDW8100209.1 GNAT family N-acetyltransferase [Anaerolineae bacterium]
MSAQAVHVRPIHTPKERLAFITFPWEVYRGDPNWVPPLISERRAFLDPARNPSFQHMDCQLFVAERNGRIVGTIAAFINYRHNEFHNERIGFFGFFETIPDYTVAEALLSTACDWVRAHGMTAIRGPANFSTNDEVGMLVDGFDSPPVILMTYNPCYYPEFVERFGFRKAQDLLAYHIDIEIFREHPEQAPAKLLRVVEKIRQRGDFTVRRVDFRRLPEEVERFKAVYNSAWEKNWGFVPLTDAEIDHMAKNLKQIIDPAIVFIAEAEGRPIGVILPLPDLNQPLRLAYPRPDVPEWWTLLKFFWHWKMRRRVTLIRVIAMGVIEPYRTRGVDAVMYYEMGKAALERGYKEVEMSWILESNTVTNNTIKALGGRHYKTYRIYEKTLP